jgi:hypothetical protein
MDAGEYQRDQIKLTNQCDLSQSVDNFKRVKCLEDVPWYGSGGVHGGLYALHLKHWLSVFDPEQFLLIPLSAYKKDPVPSLNAIATRLGLDSTKLAHEKIGQHINLDPERDMHGKGSAWVGNIVRSKGETDASDRLKEFFSPFNDELAALVAAKNIPLVKGGEGVGALF